MVYGVRVLLHKLLQLMLLLFGHLHDLHLIIEFRSLSLTLVDTLYNDI